MSLDIVIGTFLTLITAPLFRCNETKTITHQMQMVVCDTDTDPSKFKQITTTHCRAAPNVISFEPIGGVLTRARGSLPAKKQSLTEVRAMSYTTSVLVQLCGVPCIVYCAIGLVLLILLIYGGGSCFVSRLSKPFSFTANICVIFNLW